MQSLRLTNQRGKELYSNENERGIFMIWTLLVTFSEPSRICRASHYLLFLIMDYEWKTLTKFQNQLSGSKTNKCLHSNVLLWNGYPKILMDHRSHDAF